MFQAIANYLSAGKTPVGDSPPLRRLSAIDFRHRQPTERELLHAMETEGLVALRGLLEPDSCQAFAKTYEQKYRELALQNDQQELTSHRVFSDAKAAALSAVPQLERYTIEHIVQPKIMQTLLCSALGQDTAYYNRMRSRIRIAAPPSSDNPNAKYHGLHTDSWGQQFGGMCTVWVALTDCGEAAGAPSIEFFIGKPPPENAAKVSYWVDAPGAGDGWYDSLQKTHAQHFWRPDIKAGDIFIFRDYVPHRTYGTPSMTKNRISLDLRIVATINGEEAEHAVPVHSHAG